MGSLKPGSRVWTRHLVSVTLGPDWGFASPWADLGGAVDRCVYPRALAHIPGTSIPDATTFIGYCKRL